MTERIIDLADNTASLHVRDGLLVIARRDEDEVRVPLGEIAVVVASNPYLRFTQAVLSGLPEHGASLVICNTRHLPVAMLMPLDNHTTQAERFAAQASASLPTKKRAWQTIVRTKITAQARLLQELHGNDGGLSTLAERVRSGDSDNLEAQASQRYWPRLFGDPTFRRRRDGEDQNRLLNYGYAVLRAAVARAICGAGLHPGLGIHHHNRYDAFCLADDLIEPYRPLVDREVARIVAQHGSAVAVDRETKPRLLALLTNRYPSDGEERMLFDILSATASSLAAVFLKKKRDLLISEI